MFSRSIQKKLFVPVLKIKSQRLGTDIIQAMGTSRKILDLGCGDMVITKFVTNKCQDCKIIGIDVVDTNLTDLKPVIYKGNKLPFEDNSFDFVYTIFTLHHSTNPRILLKEAVRVSNNRIAIIEEVYENKIEKTITSCCDWIVNRVESSDVNIPFNFLKDNEWKKLFSELNCKLVAEKRVYQLPFWFTKQKLYLIEKL